MLPEKRQHDARREAGRQGLSAVEQKFRGEDIFVSVWNLHHSPDIWVEAEKFNPERWPLDGPNPNEVNQNFSYLPFGGGPRKFIGEVFASYEVEMTTGATIHTTEGLKMTVTRRPNPPAIPFLEVQTLTVHPELTGVPCADKPASVG